MKNSKVKLSGNNEKQEILHQYKTTGAGVVTSSLHSTIVTYQVMVRLLCNCQEKKIENPHSTTKEVDKQGLQHPCAFPLTVVELKRAKLK